MVVTLDILYSNLSLNQGEYFNMILNLKEQFSKNLKLTFLQM